MDTTIRNLDERVYRRLRARALAAGITVGEALNQAMVAYLGRPEPGRSASLLDVLPEPYPAGDERLSEEIDKYTYGA